MNKVVGEISTIAVGIIGLAIIAVLVGTNSKTAEVFGAAGSAFSGALGAAMQPVTGGRGAYGNLRVPGNW